MKTETERLPLSYAQQRLWFLYRMEGPSPTYNIPMALRLEGELDETAMEAALADVLARHESLRTIFPEQDGVPFQEVLAAEMACPGLIPVAVTEATLPERLAQAAATGIDLSRELPLRAWLFRLEPQRQVLLLLLHHIAGDGWSMGPLARDLARAYAARSRGEAPAWAELPIQYADYTLWQRELLGEESDPESLLAQQLGFWRRALAEVPEELNLPWDRPRPAVASYRGASVGMHLEAGLHRRLIELARAGGASLFMVLQAGVAALLSRLGAGEDIPIGAPIAGREERELEELVGFFVNTLVLRTDVSGDPSFGELVARVRAFDLEAYGQQEVPFERVVEALQPARSLTRHPLFQVMLALENVRGAGLQLPGIAVSLEPLAGVVAKFDLTFGLTEYVGPGGEPLGIWGGLEYSLDLFERPTAEAIAGRFVRLLEAAVAAPNVPLHRLEILDPGERHTLLVGLNATFLEVPALTLPALFEAQVERSPQGIALVFEERTLSYGTLNAQANRLAHLLMGRGVGPESLVALALPRSIEMVVALLGILKAGAAYLPLDPDYPEERLSSMLRDAEPACVLSAARLAGRLRLPEGVAQLLLDDSETVGALAQRPETNPSQAERTQPLTLQNPAYVIYTSGSTGAPKGVVVTHAGIPSLVAAQITNFTVTPGARVLQFASLSFDATLWEIAMALGSGATLVLPTAEERSGDALAEVIRSRGVTHATFPPAVQAN